jgi:hypothetical protein
VLHIVTNVLEEERIASIFSVEVSQVGMSVGGGLKGNLQGCCNCESGSFQGEPSRGLGQRKCSFRVRTRGSC